MRSGLKRKKKKTTMPYQATLKFSKFIQQIWSELISCQTEKIYTDLKKKMQDSMNTNLTDVNILVQLTITNLFTYKRIPTYSFSPFIVFHTVEGY